MMGQPSKSLGLLIVVTVALIGLARAGVQAPDLRSAGGTDQAAPEETAPTAADELATMVEDVRGATAVRYGARDSAGNTMDTAKIIVDPAGGYLAVYHSPRNGMFSVSLARSTNLLDWTYLRDLGSHASQPYIAALSDGGFLVVWETDAPGYTSLSFRYYASRAHLLAGRVDRSFDALHTRVAAMRYAEGTPNIYTAKLAPDIDHSTIEVGFHYFRDGDVDRQARGILRNFSSWTTRRETAVDAAVKAHGVAGNIGDRDNIAFRDGSYDLVEGQRVKGDFGSWRIFLWDWQTRIARELAIHTHRDSSAFANPALTALRGPDGRPALVVSLFIPLTGAGPGEAGQLIYYRVLASSESMRERQPCRAGYERVRGLGVAEPVDDDQPHGAAPLR